jgi:hypothetical protein
MRPPSPSAPTAFMLIKSFTILPLAPTKFSFRFFPTGQGTQPGLSVSGTHPAAPLSGPVSLLTRRVAFAFCWFTLTRSDGISQKWSAPLKACSMPRPPVKAFHQAGFPARPASRRSSPRLVSTDNSITSASDIRQQVLFGRKRRGRMHLKWARHSKTRFLDVGAVQPK